MRPPAGGNRCRGRAAVHREARDVLAIQLDIAAVGADEAGDDVETGGFARAVGALAGRRLRRAGIEKLTFRNTGRFIALGEVLGGEAAGHFPDARVRVDFHFGHDFLPVSQFIRIGPARPCERVFPHYCTVNSGPLFAGGGVCEAGAGAVLLLISGLFFSVPG